MRHTLAVLLVTSLAFGSQVGCGRSPSEGSLQSAIQSVDQAQQGFVPGGSGNKNASMTTYRQSKLKKAANDLDQAVRSGDPVEQVIAHRLKAQLAISHADDAAARASRAYAALMPRAVRLLTPLTVAAQSSRRSASLGQGQPKLIEKLSRSLQQQQNKTKQLARQAAKLKQQIKPEQEAKDQADQQRQAAMSQAQKLRQQGFTAKGDKQMRLYQQATAAERKGNTAAAKAQQHQLRIDMLQSRLDVVQSQLDLSRTLATHLQKRLKDAKNQQQTFAANVKAASSHAQASIDNLLKKFQQVRQRYENQVAANLATATTQLEHAIKQYETALKIAGGVKKRSRASDMQQAIRQDMLAARSEQVRLLVERMQVASNFAKTLSMLSSGAQRIKASGAQPIQQLATQLKQTQSQLAEQAKAAIKSGSDLAQQVAGGSGSDVSDFAKKEAKRLQSYLDRVHDVAKSSPEA